MITKITGIAVAVPANTAYTWLRDVFIDKSASKAAGRVKHEKLYVLRPGD